MDLHFEVELSQHSKREMVRPLAEGLGLVARPVFWTSILLLVLCAPLVLLVLNFWSAVFVTLFAAALLAVQRLGVWHPSPERRADALAQIQRIPDRAVVRVADDRIQVGSGWATRRLKWKNVARCAVNASETILADRGTVIVVPARAFAATTDYDAFVAFVKTRIPDRALTQQRIE